MFDRRWPLKEDGLRWKTSFDGWRSLMKNYLWWKMTCDGKWPLMKDDLWWKVTFDGSWHLTEDNLWWKTTLDERRPLNEDNLWWTMEDDVWWKTTFDRRQLLMEDDLCNMYSNQNSLHFKDTDFFIYLFQTYNSSFECSSMVYYSYLCKYLYYSPLQVAASQKDLLSIPKLSFSILYTKFP